MSARWSNPATWTSGCVPETVSIALSRISRARSVGVGRGFSVDWDQPNNVVARHNASSLDIAYKSTPFKVEQHVTIICVARFCHAGTANAIHTKLGRVGEWLKPT